MVDRRPTRFGESRHPDLSHLVFHHRLFRLSLVHLTLCRPTSPSDTAPAIAGHGGDPLAYEVEIENRSRRAALALSLMEMDIPAGLQLARHVSPPSIDRLAPGANCTLSLQLTSLQRGHYKLPGLCATSSYPLGLFRGISFHRQETWVTVHPTYAELTSFNLPFRPASAHTNRGVAYTHVMAATAPDFAYVREYRYGDNPRHLHWASWARTGTPAVKVHQEATGPHVGLVLDTAVNNARDMHALESGISAVAGIAAYLLREAIAFDCFATADLLFHLCHDAPTLRFTHLMNTLAGLQSRAAVEWPAVANRLFEQAPQCNTVALIALDWSRETASFVTQLQHHGIGVRTLVIRQGPMSRPSQAADDLSQLLPGHPWPQQDALSPWSGP